MQDIALVLLFSISSFAGIEKRGVKVVSLHFAQSYFCILTARFKGMESQTLHNFVW